MSSEDSKYINTTNNCPHRHVETSNYVGPVLTYYTAVRLTFQKLEIGAPVTSARRTFTPILVVFLRFFVFELRARTVRDRQTDRQTDGRTDRRTDEQDLQCGLSGRPQKNVLNNTTKC